MKKLIAKTIAISLAIVIGLISVIYLLIASFSPAMLSNIYFRLNNKNLTLKYSEIAYQKSEQIESLSTLVERSIKFDDNALTEKYGFIFITHSDYEDLLTKKDSGYNYYIVGSLCEALYCSNKKETAITLAFENTLVYSSVNPIRVVISLAVENGDINLLSTIKQKLESRENKNQSILNDITLITNYINERS